MIALLLFPSILLRVGHTAIVSYNFDVRDWVVDYQRPTITPRAQPFDLPRDAQMGAQLANDMWPGPALEAYEGDTIEVNVVNNLLDNDLNLQFEGVDVKVMPNRTLLQQGGEFKYTMVAPKLGTYHWHGSPMQAAKGLQGAIVVRSHTDPFANKYQEERVIVLSDARSRPDVCFDDQGALLRGCDEVEKATLNGQWGDGSKKWPTPVVEVVEGKCYRMRFVGLMNVAGTVFQVSIDHHTVQLLSDDGSLRRVSSFSVKRGVGSDVLLCADQHPVLLKEYSIRMELVGKTMSKEFKGILKYTTLEGVMSGQLETRAEHAAPPLALPPVASGTVGREKFDPSECEVSYTFDLHEYIVDYKRPTVDLGGKAARKQIGDIPQENRRAALLVNNTYPGPTIEAVEGQLICVTVLNNFDREPTAIHWHGQHMKGYPAFDGVYGVTQGAIGGRGGSMIYRWRANVGTAFYHGHLQAQQADKGLKGIIVIHGKDDPHKHLYDEEMVIALSDEWADASVCLRVEGAQPGNPVCAEIDKATWNGVWGDGSDDYPWPMFTVEQGKCYRMRFVGIMGQAQNFQISMAGHNMTLIAVDGADVEPIVLSQFNLHAGERADVVVCADQPPGNYLMSAVYDLATFLETAPAPRLPRVDSSKFWAFLNYRGHTEKPGTATKKILGGYNAPPGTGGGLSPTPVGGSAWDTNLQSAWTQVRNLNPVPQPEKADVTYVLNVGIAGPSFAPGVPYGHSAPLFMFTNKTSWKKPQTPLLHTQGKCGADGVPFINVPETATTVELIINNLSPTAHVLHMHGMRFQVVNYAPYSSTWCSNAHFECFFIPVSVARALDCKEAVEGDNSTNGPGNEYWGCPYQPSDIQYQNLDNPLQKDMISLWRRSWAVIRFKVENPGVWLFHCHMEQHIPTGQMMAFNLLPSKQPPIPDDIPSEGPCSVWNGRGESLRLPKRDNFYV